MSQRAVNWITTNTIQYIMLADISSRMGTLKWKDYNKFKQFTGWTHDMQAYLTQ
jgi:hypothetical protein